MRTYGIQLRLIQTAGLIAVLILISGVFKASIWGDAGKDTTGLTTSKITENTGADAASNQTTVQTNSKIVALGDSFTLGYPLGVDRSWTKTLADGLQVEVINKGKSRQTGKDLLARFDQDVLAEKPGRVIIFAGTGDAIQNVSLKDYQGYIQTLVEKAKSNHIMPILVMPVWYPGFQQGIVNFREWEISYAQTEHITVLDFNEILFDANSKYLKGLSSDGKYPNTKGYQAMGEYAARVLK
ncbi:MAG: GDSL-type esterase/lipase family protein [Desulfitobacteriaceae bacterium]